MADLIELPQRCTCAEVHGEDPNCALHGVATEWALENILPRDWQEMVLEQAAELEKLAPLAISLQATAEAAAHSTSELTALRERDRRTLTDPQRLIWRDDVEGICPTPDMCFEYGEHARCGPCAIKQADARGVTSDLSLPNLPEVSRLQRENAALSGALAALETAEFEYRHLHDLHGDADLRAGRAWDWLRRKGDAARALLAQQGTGHA